MNADVGKTGWIFRSGLAKLTQIRTEQGAWTAQSPKYNSAGAEPQPNTALVLNLRGNDADKKSTDNNGPVLHNKEN